MQITDAMVEAALDAAKAAFFLGHPADKAKQMRAALEAALGTAIKQPARIQDPRVLAESLIVLGPSSDGAVERDLRHALGQQAACIEDLAAALKVFDVAIYHAGFSMVPFEISKLHAARAALEKWGLNDN